MPTWRLTRIEPQAQDAVVVIMMALTVSPSYVAWWMMMCSGPLGLDELGNDSDGEVASQPLEEDDQMDTDNPIHDGPPPTRGLDVLIVITPIPGNK